MEYVKLRSTSGFIIPKSLIYVPGPSEAKVKW